MKVIIDRVEGNFAVGEKEDKTMVNIDVRILPEKVKEGDVLNIEIKVDKEETERRKKSIEELARDLWV